MLDLIKIVADELGLSKNSVENTVKLLDEDSTVPFIARYRKEVTGSLDEEQIRNIEEKINYLRNLEKRKEEVIRLIEEQGKLTDELKLAISTSVKLQEVEDLYLPYKRKKKTKADIAKEQGLEPLANFIMTCDSIDKIKVEAEKFIVEEVTTIELAIEGAKLILAQNLSESAKYRESLRERMLKYATISSTLIEKNKEKDTKQVYKDYYAHEEKVSYIASHRTLALNRGENEDVLRVSIKFDDKTREYVNMEGIILLGNRKIESFMREIVIDSLDRLILPSIEREVRNILTEKAEIDSTKIFKENLKNLLMQPPLKEKAILGLDPGFRTGCKTVVINKNGFFELDDVLYLVEEMHHPKQVEDAKNKILKYIETYHIDIIAIGNGTASRETESFVAKIIKESKRKVFYIIVNEAGASVYSASKLAAEEFPKLDVTARGAISIARRIQDPLAELVKIDPKSIGVGMYQHDLNQKNLEESLGDVIESVVNNVGVNVNTASWALLAYVSGIKKNIAKNIVDYRQENGNFTKRSDLKKVKGLGEKAYTLCAGFIVVPEGDNPLDDTIIHPESYDIAKAILKEANLTLKDLGDRNKVSTALENINAEEFANKNSFGKETTLDVYNALCKERRDPRDSIPTPILKSDILKIEDLKEGMDLEGTVRNVTNFGAFIDIGLKNDALLHVSEFPTRITDLLGILAVGDIIKVKVKGVELGRGRVSLTKKGL